MRVWLIRHGETEYNKERRYQGRLDIPLAEKEKADLMRCVRPVERVFVTPLKRTAQTADILFPEAEQVVVPGLVEMDFGKFEGHTYEELKDDPEYQEFHKSGGWSDCPSGEGRANFSERVRRAFRELVETCAVNGNEEITIVTHGGTIMALMEHFGVPSGEYYVWLPGNGEGYELDVALLTKDTATVTDMQSRSAEADDVSGRTVFCRKTDDLRVRIVRRVSYNKTAGRIHLYHGNGRGKSSTAAGTALRALHAGYEVTYLQFCKSEGSGETEELQRLGARLLFGEDGEGFVSKMNDAQKQALYEKQSRILKEVLEEYREKKPEKPRLLVLDEVCAAINYGVLDAAVLRDLLIRKPSDLEIIMTGREPAFWLQDAADYVTEYSEKKHPFREGLSARKGIEF